MGTRERTVSRLTPTLAAPRSPAQKGFSASEGPLCRLRDPSHRSAAPAMPFIGTTLYKLPAPLPFTAQKVSVSF
ncbi:unnamed protein product, partial [Iphiclides podalirius]